MHKAATGSRNAQAKSTAEKATKTKTARKQGRRREAALTWQEVVQYQAWRPPEQALLRPESQPADGEDPNAGAFIIDPGTWEIVEERLPEATRMFFLSPRHRHCLFICFTVAEPMGIEPEDIVRHLVEVWATPRDGLEGAIPPVMGPAVQGLQEMYFADDGNRNSRWVEECGLAWVRHVFPESFRDVQALSQDFSSPDRRRVRWIAFFPSLEPVFSGYMEFMRSRGMNWSPDAMCAHETLSAFYGQGYANRLAAGLRTLAAREQAQEQHGP